MYKRFFKRIIDFSVALVALIVLSPLLLIVTVWLHFANKGAGAFFLQERPGLHSKVFKIIKYKTMTDERGSDGELLPDGERITRVGRFVRSTSIDELPQLINVLKGDMSLIGPRPLLVKYLPYYTKRELLRHTVRPGISGWAQVHGRNNLDWDERLELDAWYAENVTLKIDLNVVIRTIHDVITRKDIIEAPSEDHDLDVVRKRMLL
jgi:lipopolysaccharide/colanic/teichoic acid biosynthesis glycosyltransferase